jgi:hypothetical protein
VYAVTWLPKGNWEVTGKFMYNMKPRTATPTSSPATSSTWTTWSARSLVTGASASPATTSSR